MRVLKYFVCGVILYVVFLIWRFPYQTLLERSIAQVETATGVKIVYTPVSAGIFGIELKDVSVQTTSGARMAFTGARAGLGFTGLSADLIQEKGKAHLTLSYSSQLLTLDLDNVDVDSGTPEFGKVRCPKATLSYNLVKHDGKGDVRLIVPKFKAPLPIPEMPVEVGAQLQMTPKTAAGAPQGSEMRADVRLLGGTEFSANGPVLVDSQPGTPPRLTGTLTFKTPLKSGTLRIEGNWPKPQWTIVASN